MKLNEFKTKIVERGYRQDVTFVNNVCPCCGNITDKCSVEPIDKYTFILFHYKGREARIDCEECGTTYVKEVWDERELQPTKEIIGSILIIIIIVFFFGGIIGLIAGAAFDIAECVAVGCGALVMAVIFFLIGAAMWAEEG